MKPHYFSELDVPATLRALTSLPGAGSFFWRSEELWDSLETGEVVALDPPFFGSELRRRFEAGDPAAKELLSAALGSVPFPTLCQARRRHEALRLLSGSCCGLQSIALLRSDNLEPLTFLLYE